MGKRWSAMTPAERNGRATAQWKRVRQAILTASDICWMCGRPGADTIDHVVPLARGGTNDPQNLRPAHGRRQPWGCPGNYGRRDRAVEVAERTREW